MKVLRAPYEEWRLDAAGSAVSIGVYDGVHRGHQHVLRAIAAAVELPLTVVTFANHPASVVNPSRAPRMLTSLEHRLELLAAQGVATTAVLEFDDRMRRMTASEWVDEVLVERIRARIVAVGEDFRFGYELRGDVETLRQIGVERGFDVMGLPILGDGEPIRSTAIRAALGAGDVARAAVLLGRHFQIRARVLRGDQRGRAIGFPTANLDVPHVLARPRWGVYSAWAGVGAADRPAVVNVGVRPTIGGERELVEVHLLDGDADLYGKELRVDFVSRLRDELRFATLEALVEQIARDADRARIELLG